MIAYLSPAKRLRPAELPPGFRFTKPMARDKTQKLLQALRAYEPYELESVLRTSPVLAQEAFVAFAAYGADDCKWPAVLSYSGLAYWNLDPGTLSREALCWLSDHLIIGSAFYGPLRPFDPVRPHRLGFHARLPLAGGNLYDFWGDDFYRALFGRGEIVINLSSGEYSRAFTPYLQPDDRVVEVLFQTERMGRRIILPTEAKMARGAMVRHLALCRAKGVEALFDFSFRDFCYEPALSYENKLVFLQRRRPA